MHIAVALDGSEWRLRMARTDRGHRTGGVGPEEPQNVLHGIPGDAGTDQLQCGSQNDVLVITTLADLSGT